MIVTVIRLCSMNETLRCQLVNDLRNACDQFTSKHVGDRLYSVALYTNGEYSWVGDSFSTDVGLAQVANKYLADDYYRDKWKTESTAMAELKWSPCDSPYHNEHLDCFDASNAVIDDIWNNVAPDSDIEYDQTCQMIRVTCLSAIKELRTAGYFDGHDVVLNLLMGDQSDKERIENASVLNPPEAVARYRKEIGE